MLWVKRHRRAQGKVGFVNQGDGGDLQKYSIIPAEEF